MVSRPFHTSLIEFKLDCREFLVLNCWETLKMIKVSAWLQSGKMSGAFGCSVEDKEQVACFVAQSTACINIQGPQYSNHFPLRVILTLTISTHPHSLLGLDSQCEATVGDSISQQVAPRKPKVM
jgi:hypothetical protein